MANTKDERSQLVWIGLVVAGLVGLALGLVWPSMQGPPSDEARAIAIEFLEAGRAMESLPSSKQGGDRAAEVEAARRRLQEAKARADATRDAPERAAFWFKIAGGALAVVGIGGLLASQPR